MTEEPSEINVLRHFTSSFKQILIDEIALEGLEGIPLDLLWRRVELRISSPVTEKMKIRFWKNILEMRDICVYQLPEPLPYLKLVDRFTIVDPETGELLDPPDYLDGYYEYCPVDNEYGSCKYYDSRNLLPADTLVDIPYGKIEASFGNTLVLVASIEKRWQALAGHLPMSLVQALTPIHYCVLELIGKSRTNGQMTVGTTNLTKIVKEPKTLFYHRKLLCDQNLIKKIVTTQVIKNRCVQSLLLRLVRFHQPKILSLPKKGKMYELAEHLRQCPNYEERSEIMFTKNLFNVRQAKRLRKKISIFEFYDNEEEPPRKKKKGVLKKRKAVSIITKSDESSQSEDETEPIQNQFKIGVSLSRQAYELILDAGPKGISQMEIGQSLGMEFYNSRVLCKGLKLRKLVKEFSEDRGRQRVHRYIAKTTGIQHTTFEDEKNKFLEKIKKNSAVPPNDVEIPSTSAMEISGTEIIANDTETTQKQEDYDALNVTELTANDISIEKSKMKSLAQFKQSLSLRQLQFANGIIKVVNARQCITGFQPLSNLVAKETNMAPMGNRALKWFLRMFVAAGQIKMYKVRWPGIKNKTDYRILICPPYIKITDPIIRNKCKEANLRRVQRVHLTKAPAMDNAICLSLLVNPRYMKIQKLHEMIIQKAYFEPLPETKYDKPGFLSMIDLIPELTVKFAISNMSISGLTEIVNLKISAEHLDLMLKDTPPEIGHVIINSKSFRNSLRANLKALGMYGLIQLVHPPYGQGADYNNSHLTTFVFYVNRNAKILDTSGKWPRQCDVTTLERHYYFENEAVVQKYWRDVYDISMRTEISAEEPRQKSLAAPVRHADEVHAADDGARHGDGRGPCGLDSCFYLEVPRLWRTLPLRDVWPTQARPRKTKVSIPKLPKTKTKSRRKRRTVTKANPVMKLKMKKKGRRRIATSTITWSQREDDVVVWSMVAISIVSPQAQPGALRIRNSLAKDILSLHDPRKTQSICHRRALMLQTASTSMHEKESLLNEMKRREVTRKYEGLVKKLLARNTTNITKFVSDARLPMLELAYLIWQVSESDVYKHRLPCIAADIGNFYKNYDITPYSANKIYNIYRLADHAILREAVFFAVMLSYNAEHNLEVATRIHAAFAQHPESELRTVIDQLRKSGAVSARQKTLNNHVHRVHKEDLSTSVYKLCVNYKRRWMGRLNSEFAVNLSILMENDLSTSNIKGSGEMNCLLCEMQAMGFLEIHTAIDAAVVNISGHTDTEHMLRVNAVDFEMKHKLKSGSVTWVKKTTDNVQWDTRNVASLYQDIDFETVLQSLVKDAVISSEALLEQAYDVNDVIIRHLTAKAETGSSFGELLEITKFSDLELTSKLQSLEARNLVKRVGLQDNTIVLLKYIKKWAFKLENNYVIITPWLSLDLEIRIEIFLEWASVVMNKVFENPGLSISYIAEACELITCRALQDICTFLAATKCVDLKICKCKVPTLFSDDDEMPLELEFNPYESTEHICVFPKKNALTRYTYLKKLMLVKHHIR